MGLQEIGQTEAAIEACRHCLVLKPDFTDAWYSLGLILQEQGRREQAEEAFEHAARTDPRHAPSRLALGASLLRGSRRDAALPHLRAAVRLAPNDPVASSWLRRAQDEVLPDGGDR